MCRPFINMEIACFEMSFYVCMKNYYRDDALKISFLMSWVDEILWTFGGISDKYEKKWHSCT